MQLGAKERVEQCICSWRLRTLAVGDEDASHAEPSGRRRSRAHVIRLHAADGDERVRTTSARLGRDETELADLVAAKAERDGIVALDENPRRAGAEHLTQSIRLVERGDAGEERLGVQCAEPRQRRGGAHRPAVAGTGYSGKALASSRTSPRTVFSTF